MATLIRNVWIDDRYYGPDHGGDSELPAALVDRVPVDAWSTPPVANLTPHSAPDAPDYERAARRDAILDQIDTMTRDDLVATARRNNIKVNPRGRVADLREVLRAAL